jgi:hypothetical protein
MSVLLGGAAGQGAVVRCEAMCGIAADNLLTGRRRSRSFDIGHTTEQVAGVSAAVLAAAAVVALMHAGRAGRFDRRWWPVLVELMLAGALCGAGWRILTAGVIGANIGAGLVLWVGAPIVAALVGLAVFDWLSVRAQRQHPGTKR